MTRIRLEQGEWRVVNLSLSPFNGIMIHVADLRMSHGKGSDRCRVMKIEARQEFERGMDMLTRRRFLQGVATAAGAAGMMSGARLSLATSLRPAQIKAFCIDFNWVNGKFAPPGHWAEASPAEHVAWYEGMGANVIQTFAVSCNGYAWYKGGRVPAQPGLKHNFLTEVVKLATKRG